MNREFFKVPLASCAYRCSCRHRANRLSNQRIEVDLLAVDLVVYDNETPPITFINTNSVDRDDGAYGVPAQAKLNLHSRHIHHILYHGLLLRTITYLPHWIKSGNTTRKIGSFDRDPQLFVEMSKCSSLNSQPTDLALPHGEIVDVLAAVYHRHGVIATNLRFNAVIRFKKANFDF